VSQGRTFVNSTESFTLMAFLTDTLHVISEVKVSSECDGRDLDMAFHTITYMRIILKYVCKVTQFFQEKKLALNVLK
jgi:hypothetical protein